MDAKLSDLVARFFKERDLPFCLLQNPIDYRIWGIRRTSWPKGYATTPTTHIGFVSDKRCKVALHDEWLDSRDPQFFEKLERELLK